MRRWALGLAALGAAAEPAAPSDWLLSPLFGASPFVATVEESASEVVLRNGLVARHLTLAPAFGTVRYTANATVSRGGPREVLRAVGPEAVVWLDGTRYNVGGLQQEPLADGAHFTAYLNASELRVSADAGAFSYSRHTVGAPSAPFPWTPGTRHSPQAPWPPRGKELTVTFTPPKSVAKPSHAAVEISVHYVVYDGIPMIAKHITVAPVKPTGEDVVVTAATVELLRINAGFGPYMTHGSFRPGSFGANGGASGAATPLPLLQARTDQAHSAACTWQDDYPQSSGAYNLKDQGAVEPVLNCSYTLGPGAHVAQATSLHRGLATSRGALHDPDIAASGVESFTSFTVFELALDSWDIERQALARHRATSIVAPHVLENPIFFHATDFTDDGFKTSIDQMAEVGFEMLIFSFGSGFVMETSDPTYLAKLKGRIDYAKSKGIEVGGYDLICLDRGHGGYGGNVGDQWDNVLPSGQLGQHACFASGWYDKLHDYVLTMINTTGLAMLETDGPYGGESCASTKHEYHHGLEDSIYKQTRMQSQFYNEMRALNVFVNQPDNFFFQGGQKTGMGYDENQYSLPRWRDVTISRAGMYDDLYEHLPTQGWMFVPISDYHTGGDAAAFAPKGVFQLAEYEYALAQYLGAGVAACYRGPRLYDTDETKQVVQKWVSFYKAHRLTLIAPVVHLRRPDMQSWDGWLHVRPGTGVQGEEVGVAMVFNPTDKPIETDIAMPVYYTGLTDAAVVSVNNATGTRIAVNRDYTVFLHLKMGPRSITTAVITSP